MIARVLVLTLAFLAPTAALAHSGGEPGFAHGFLHPLSGLDHVLAMVAVGIFAAMLGGRALIWVPLSFINALVLGWFLGVTGVEIPYVELGIAASSVAIGGAAALGRAAPMWVAGPLVAGFAVFHGHAHGAEMPLGSDGLVYALGFIGATAALHGLGAAIGLGGALSRNRLALRCAGGIAAVGGIGLLAGVL